MIAARCGAVVGSHFVSKAPQLFGLWGRRLFGTWLLAEELVSTGDGRAPFTRPAVPPSVRTPGTCCR